MKHLEASEFLQNFNKERFESNLIDWFQDQKRDLPWRMDQDPYKIWVSEIMLQQTQVETVIPYFERFITKFPTPQDLANADEQEVLKAWEGLGYYSRARNLQSAVKEVSEKYEGKVPKTPELLGELKGVGPYTLGAILSIAYDMPEPAVDGNVMRVMSRVLRIEDDIAKQKTRKIFEAVLREIISTKDPSSFNQGLMELGALICKPKNPNCSICPVQKHCRAYHAGKQTQLPIKSKAKKQKTHAYYAVVLMNKDGEVYIEKRPNEGLLANLWQFPMINKSEIDFDYLSAWLEQTYPITTFGCKKLSPVKHVFSHVIWELEVYQFVVEVKEVEGVVGRFVSEQDLTAYPFPVSHQKIISQLSF